jgi:hypothetical protein
MFDQYAGQAPRQLTPLRAVLTGAALVGVLDGLWAVVSSVLRGGSPARIFQFVASGLIGRDAAYAGGLATVLLGVLLHFTVAFLIVGTYFLASRRLPPLVAHPVPCGLAYGVAAYLVMHFVVVPLSAAPLGANRSALASLALHAFGHALLVGLPSALVSSRVPPAAVPALPAAQASGPVLP